MLVDSVAVPQDRQIIVDAYRELIYGGCGTIMIVVRSRDVPMWAYLLSLVLTPFPVKSALMRARTQRVLRITAIGNSEDRAVELRGDANEAVSKVLVTTSHDEANRAMKSRQITAEGANAVARKVIDDAGLGAHVRHRRDMGSDLTCTKGPS